MKSRTLSRNIEAIEYVHADDGLPYRHDFTRGDSDIRLRKDGSILIRNKDRKLWADFVVDSGRTQPYLINPQGKPSSRSRRMARTKRPRNKLGHFTKGSTRRKNRPSRSTAAVARRPRRSAAPAAPAKRRRRRGSNPATLTMNGMIGAVTGAFINGALVEGGKLGTRYVSSLTTYAQGSMMQAVIEGGVVLGICGFGPRMVGRERAEFLAAGAASSIIERFVKQIGMTKVSALLSGAPTNGDTRAVYPAADAEVIGSYGPPAPQLLTGYGPSARMRARSAAIING